MLGAIRSYHESIKDKNSVILIVLSAIDGGNLGKAKMLLSQLDDIPSSFVISQHRDYLKGVISRRL